MRRVVSILICVLLAVAVWLAWRQGGSATKKSTTQTASAAATSVAAPGSSHSAGKSGHSTLVNTNKLALRLTNTTKSIGELLGDRHAILLENAFLDTGKPLNLSIPENLKAPGEPGAYIVQARGPITKEFRSVINAAGGQIVSYIPNDAYLVKLTSSSAGMLALNTLVQAVLPYEPYYKVQPSLLGLAVADQPLTPGTELNLGLFAGTSVADATGIIEKLGAKVVGTDVSPFGPMVRVIPSATADWTALLQAPIVQRAEQVSRRVMLNDLSRVTVGESTDTVTSSNYLNFAGSNVLVAVVDSGIDIEHPDFGIGGVAGTPDTVPPTRVTGLNPPFDLTDTDGHGTFVAGEIAGNGSQSYLVTNIPEGSVTNADFRGKAPLADLFALNVNNSDFFLQQHTALTNALISNNSWGYGGDFDYDLAAASYDAATRDALPFTSGSQPVLFVFAAGNSGGGDEIGGEGNADTITSPGTAKNVITVGALEQMRNITNMVSTIVNTGTNLVTNSVPFWQPMTDSSIQVADYSSRGNVGIGTEGQDGRFKPDVVAPGTFVVSTSSGIPPDYEWNTNAYYNPTNAQITDFPGQIVQTNSLVYYSVQVPPNAVAVDISITPNALSIPFPTNMPIYVQVSGYPDPNNAPGSIDITTRNNSVSIPPDVGGVIAGIQSIQNSGFYFAVGDSTNVNVNYDLTVTIFITNNVGDLYTVLKGMNDAIGPWYRYESGTSMSAADVSGVLALIDDYFTNTLQLTPSPALLKAMLINGSRTVGNYTYALTNTVNYQGWGLVNITNTIPIASSNLTTIPNGVNPMPLFFVDQNLTNGLTTGESHTYIVQVNTNADSFAQFLPLQATLVWTDPSGDPSAAIKLVNNLDLIVTNLDTGEVYFGNDIAPDAGYNQPWTSNTPPNLDSINNVENVILQPANSGEELGSRYSITVVGREVNVNALTAQTNDVEQDYALVVSIGEGEQPDAITSVTDSGVVSTPTTGQNITFVVSTNSPLFDQFAGENWPYEGTNTLPLGTNTGWGTNSQLTIGETNQWHFYVVTNNALDSQGSPVDVSNAAFITFNPNTLSIPRMGVNEEADPLNATRPEADIDVYVSTDPGLTNLNPVTISNCLVGAVNSGSSLGQGGTEFVFFTNSTHGEVYYVGVKSEDHEASEYAFMPIFTAQPFSQLNQNGDQVVNGLVLPVPIPDGNNAHPGSTNIFALAIYNMEVSKVTVNNWNQHQNFGDLVGALTFGGATTILNNHDGFGNTFNQAPLLYDDSSDPAAGSRHTDGPGSLANYRGKTAVGPWILSEEDNAPGMVGQVTDYSLTIQPHRNFLGPGIIVEVPPLGWFIDYLDVAPGYTNLTLFATNLPPTIAPQPLQMYEMLNSEPTLISYDQRADLTNCIPGSGPYPTGLDPGNDISVGPPLNPGRYFVGLYNPSSSQTATVFLSATLGQGAGINDIYNYSSNSLTTLVNDAVTSSTLYVPATQLVASVNVGMVVQSSQIADYTFTLISPTGQRVLLMENRGGGTTNGAGSIFVYTNVLSTTATGGAQPETNYLAVSPLGETVPVLYNFYSLPDEMTIFAGTNPATFYLPTPGNPNPYFLWDTGFTNNPSTGPGAQNTQPETFSVGVPPGYTNITIIMNEFGNPYAGGGGDAWFYTAGAPSTNYQYLEFTDDTNVANVPIKFSIPPYSFTEQSSNFTLSDFELATNGDYLAPTNVYDAFGGWTLPTNFVTTATIVTNDQSILVTNIIVLTNNEVSVVTDSADSLGDNAGSNFLALAKGTITRNIPTVPGHIYNLTFWYRGPGIVGWWRGEGDASDSSDPEDDGNNGVLVGRFNFPAGEVGQAFQMPDVGNPFLFGGTNAYVQVRQNSSLDVGKGGGFTVEGWINPTNIPQPQPLVEWLAHVPTNDVGTNVNPVVTNLVILAGPYLNRANTNYYYLLGATNWVVSEAWAEALGGHLATVHNANEQNWIFDNFAHYGGLNRNLWIGLTNTFGINFGWIDGETNVPYTNWDFNDGQPNNNCGPEDYTFMYGETNIQAGLWTAADTNGFTCGNLANITNIVYGVVQVTNIQTNGVQFWISVTNTPGTTNAAFVNSNGCLYANIVDTNFVSHEIFSAPGLIIETNVYQYVALTFNTNTGIASLYLDGTNVASTNLFAVGGPFVPKTDGDVLLGRDMTLFTNNYYTGEMDEMSIYRRSLSDAEILAIYQASAFTTNRLLGKFDPSVTPAAGLAEAQVVFGNTTTNILFGVDNQWEVESYTFTAASNSFPLQITGLQPGILLDQFAVAEAPLTNLYYFPEQSLSSLAGTSANGTWTLQVWDNINQTIVSNLSQLVNWQLSLVLESNAQVAATLQPESPGTITVGPGQIVDLAVPVPVWANDATNLLLSSTSSGQPAPVDMLFNPTNPPDGGPNDTVLLTAQTAPPAVVGGVLTVTPPSIPPGLPALVPGSTYYLGIRNNGAHAVQVSLEADFDITALTNGVPYSSYFTNADSTRYFSYNVSSNAYEATFQLLQLSSNADLVISKGAPLPTLTSSAYGSFNVSNIDENIYVLTNSSPVPLSAGTWYLGVFKRDSGVVNYTILAKELDVTNGVTNAVTIIDLTNSVPVDFTAGPGAALTNFFRFHATNTITGTITNHLAGLRFEVYNLTGNGDLTIQTNALPLAPPFFQTSQNSSRTPEIAYIRTNSLMTNLAADWYLGVPNHETNLIHFTIIAEVDTNSYFPAFPGATGSGGGAAGGGRVGMPGDVYHVTTNGDSGPGSLRDAIYTADTNRTIVFDIAGTINLRTPLIITNSYLDIAGQTSPGNGITVAGQMTAVTNAHDIIIRDVRFRRGSVDDSLQFLAVSNVVADHVSAEWSDKLLSVLNSTNITVQWSIMADSLYLTNSVATNPPMGSLLRYGSGALSFNHNLYADNYSGNPRLGDNLSLDFVNNVIYNWGLFSGLTGGTNDFDFSVNGCTNELNYTCNYLVAGPDTAIFSTNYAITNIAFFGGTTNIAAANWIFQTNNFMDNNNDGIVDGADTQWAMFTNDYTPFLRRFPLIPVPTDEAFLAYEKVLDFAGPDMAERDLADMDIVSNVRDQTGRFISVSPFSGKVALYAGESNALDSVGINNGTFPNGSNFETGVVGSAFYLDGGSQFVLVQTNDAALDVGEGNGFTIEGWVNPTSLPTGFNAPVIAEYENALGSANVADLGIHLQLNVPPPAGNGVGCIYANIKEAPTSIDHWVTTAPNLVSIGTWQHVALTYDKASGTAKIYYNGALAVSANVGSFTPLTDTKYFLIGGRTYGNSVANPADVFPGGLDQISIYKRALSSNEIAAIYLSGTNVHTSPLDGMVAWWRAEENTLDSASTNSGVAANLSYGAGEVGQAFNCNGSTTIHIADGPQFYLTNAMTVDGWIKPTGDGYAIFWRGDTRPGYDPFTLSMEGNSNIIFSINDGNNNGAIVGTKTFIPYNQWSYVAATYSWLGTYGALKFYINGNLVDQTNTTIRPFGPLVQADDPEVDIGSINTGGFGFTGDIDELTVYSRALSAAEILAIYQAGSAGKLSLVPSANGGPFPYLDTDQDGIPDFWESTFTPSLLYLPSNNNDRDGDGYTDLEEYESWLAGLHALTITNTPVGVDLMQLFGNTGNLSFFVTNGVHGSVYVTNVLGSVTNTGFYSNSFAIFTPTNNAGAATNYYGYAAFDVYVTNNDTVAYFGPQTVSVIVSAVPIVTNYDFPPVIIGLDSFALSHAQGISHTNTGGSDYYEFTVTNNSSGFSPVGALFTVTNETGPVILLASYGLPLPSLSRYDYLASNSPPNAENILVLNNSTPVPLTNGNWYLAVVNVSGSNVSYDVSATEFFNVEPPIFNFPTNNSIFTNIETTLFTVTCSAADPNSPTLPLTYSLVVGDPTNMTIDASSGVINWTPTEAQGPSTNTILVSVSNKAYSITNAFTVVVEESNLPPVLPVIPDQVVSVPDTLVVTNTATDSDIPVNPLTYSLLGAPTGAAIDANGIITWTPTTAQIGASYLFTTVVTDTNPWAINSTSLSVTNSFHVLVVSSLPGGPPQTNTAPAGTVSWFEIKVPTNAVAATNVLLFATNQPVNVWFSTNVPPTITTTNDYDLMPVATNGISVLTTNSFPTNIVPGRPYYLGVQNTNSVDVVFSLEVNFELAVAPVGVSNIFISSIIYTNIGGANGFLLTWFASSNDYFKVDWSPALVPTAWSAFTNIITYNPLYPASDASAQFNFFDDGTQTGGLGTMRFYRLLLLQATNTLLLPAQTNFIASVGVPLVVTNTAVDSNPSLTSAYQLKLSPVASAAAAINGNGVISWTPGLGDAGGEFKFTTIAADNGIPPVRATNSFTVFVLPEPSITNVLATATNVTLSWTAPTNDLFEVEWTTNLVPAIVWTVFPGNIAATNGVFTFTDTNAPTTMKFYRLLWQPLP